MKQHITKKQWDELDYKQKDEFGNAINDYFFISDEGDKHNYLPNIGQMIEFLEDDIDDFVNLGDEWMIFMKGKDKITFQEQELADALWQACKLKLCKTQT